MTVCQQRARNTQSDLAVAGTPTIGVFEHQRRGSPVPMAGEPATGGGRWCAVECFSLWWITTEQRFKGSERKSERGAAGCKRRELQAEGKEPQSQESHLTLDKRAAPAGLAPVTSASDIRRLESGLL